ncbi:hypothetical protein RHSIM_Rhsim01G0115800 [Rhododendron simsii]|uniref:Uncharacterized protein n=1 Tax=Rhododendron simsii TaxID=118357 RepID=A0A834HVA8_RHOSS|nr:hypothetical protein RHSIM_Rhsim01G0115800 [Rhododendron simsii]
MGPISWLGKSEGPWESRLIGKLMMFSILKYKGILAEILEFVMGKGLIPADGEIWRFSQCVMVPALHQKAS